MVDRIIGLIRPDARRNRGDTRLFSPDPEDRLDAARAQGKRATKALAERLKDWPPNAPGSLNAWLLLVTTKEPVWRDPMVQWQDLPLTLGTPHQGFYYPDPMGFWTEVRKWAVQLLRLREPRWGVTEALALTAFLPAGSQPERVGRAIQAMEPQLVLFLDEPSWAASRSLLDGEQVSHYITDPHRPKQVYEGFWGKRSDGVVIGKSPQHPATHNLYRADDITGYLRSAPIPRPVPPGGK
ncbi:MAG: hypothetical protein QOE93_163 [Actinomycetota bacterium]|nr:hypothetical protein [Actinomycetota bacterium]